MSIPQPEQEEHPSAHSSARETFVVHFFQSMDGALRCRVTDVRRRESRLVDRAADLHGLLGASQEDSHDA
jgi:hypothetical protein